MSTLQAIPRLSVEGLRREVSAEYAEVATDPHKGYYFHTGRAAPSRLEYDEALYAGVPAPFSAMSFGTQGVSLRARKPI